MDSPLVTSRAKGEPVILKVHRRGAYSPLTATGDIVVGGILASNNVSRSWLKNRVSGQVLYRLQHGAALPYLLYRAVNGCDVSS